MYLYLANVQGRDTQFIILAPSLINIHKALEFVHTYVWRVGGRENKNRETDTEKENKNIVR